MVYQHFAATRIEREPSLAERIAMHLRESAKSVIGRKRAERARNAALTLRTFSWEQGQ